MNGDENTEVPPAALQDYVDQAEAIIERYPQMDEENTKSKLLREFLTVLGWDVAFDAELEYSITMGSSSTYHVDYALSGTSSTPVLFVEAKGYDSTLTDNNRNQLKSYLRQTDVNWGLLTNGATYEIYRREIDAGAVDIQQVVMLDLEELPQYSGHISLLSKESLETGRSKEIAEQILDLRQAKQTLQNEKEAIAEDITTVLTEIAGDVISQEAETEAKELVDRLIDTIDQQTEADTGPSPRSSEVQEGVPPTESDLFWEEVENKVGIRKNGDSIEFRDETYDSEDYLAFARFLFEEGYITTADLPIQTSGKRYVLNTEPVHSDGVEMSEPKEVTDNVYLESHNDSAYKERWILNLGDRVTS